MCSIKDVLVISTEGWAHSPEDIRNNVPMFRGRLQLDDSVRFERLGDELANHIIGLYHHREEQDLPTLPEQVSLVREDPPDPKLSVWDEDGRIYRVLAASRLVQPTCIGLRYAARVSLREHDPEKRVVRARRSPHTARGYCALGERWYLTDADALKIKDILPNLEIQRFPDRVRGALNAYDHSFYERWTEYKWLFLCIGAEALVHTDRRNSTKQFSKRLEALAAKVGVSGWSEARLQRVYGKYRSAIVHGGPSPYPPVPKEDAIGGAPPGSLGEYLPFHDLVRRILLRCVQDPAFRQTFTSEQSIRVKYPLKRTNRVWVPCARGSRRLRAAP